VLRFLKAMIVTVSRVWELDLRSLALFRVGLGLLVIADLYLRYQPEFFQAFHTDAGVLSRSFLIDSVGDAWRLTPHLMTGTSAGMTALFIIEAICGLLLVIGWHTRAMTAACWLLTLGLQNRNPMVIQGGDVFFRMLLIIGFFLPLGARYSIDRLLQPDTDESNKKADETNNLFASAAGLLLSVQVVSVYFFSGWIKYHDPSWQTGLGVYYSLATYQFASELGIRISKWRELMFVSNWLVLALEIIAPLFVFFPPRSFPRIRSITVFVFMGFHISIVALMFVGLFPWISIVAWMPLIPSWFWDRLCKLIPAPNWEHFSIYYRDKKDICHRLAVYTSRFFGIPRSQLIVGGSTESTDTDAPSNCIYAFDSATGKFYAGAELAFNLLKRRSANWSEVPILKLFTIPLERTYTVVASSLAWIMRTRLRPLLVLSFRDTRYMYGRSVLAQLICLVGLYVITLFNLASLPQLKYSPWVMRNDWAHLLGLDQNWAMFSRPFVDDGWFVFPGKLADSSDIDVFRDGAPVTFEPPKLVAATFKGDRWRKYMTNIWASRGEKHRLPFGRYLCRTWNSTHAEARRLETFEMVYMRQDTRPDGTKQPATPVKIWRHECFDGMLKKWGKN
jgi:hypothetical protein